MSPGDPSEPFRPNITFVTRADSVAYGPDLAAEAAEQADHDYPGYRRKIGYQVELHSFDCAGRRYRVGSENGPHIARYSTEPGGTTFF
jgi:hypothetical protein